ncbi:molybdopterin-dependent oxidoreductase [Adlercreutzia sp. ZJ138]|uniref:molybdopterin-containing oxidoreductase family protein n=1 Tax=Adlercreutzia sp. ZJ138 TaxID=2709405 RepID=UPI0013EDD543|nr:molybdopterin-dependent oxidoreductase [Adlercreutzia sp. ZJ138]
MGESLTRRNFLKGAGAVTASVAAAATLGSCSQDTKNSNLVEDENAAGVELAEEQEFFCTCSWSCSFCQYNIYTRNGNVSHMLPKPDYAYRTCLKGRSRILRAYSPARVQYPMKRVGYSLDNPNGEMRGKDEWERITWEEAGELIGEQWKRTEEQFGPLANTYYQGGGGAQGSLNGNAGLIMRLFNATACTKWDYSFDNATNTGLTRAGVQWFDQNEPQDFVNSDYILMAGANPVGAQIQMWQHLANAQEAGAKIVCIDPLFSPTVAKADKWIPVKPGTDPALFLGLIKKFMDEETYKADFVLNYTCAPFLVNKADGMYVVGEEEVEGAPFWVTGEPQMIKPNMVQDADSGEIMSYQDCKNPAWSYTGDENYVTAWDLFKEHVQSYTLDYVMNVTGISEDDFNFLYDMLQSENKIAHYINFGGGAYENGLHQAYAMSALIAMTGNFGEPGRSVGGFDAMYGNFFGHALCAPSNGKMVSSVTFLAACDVMNSGQLMGKDYPVKDLIVSHGGMIGGSVNSNRVKDEFLRKLEQVVVIDPWMTDTAKMADIVLPACDMYEFEDVVPLSHEHNVRISEKCIDPMYEAKPDSEIARFLAPYLGVEDAVCDVTDEDWWKGTFDDVAAAVECGITLDTLRENKEMRYVKEQPYIGNKDLKNFITTTGRLYFYVDTPVPRTPSNFDVESTFEREKMPTYFENKIAGENSEYAADYPLLCISWRNPTRVHMTQFMGTWAREVAPEPVLFVNPDDAKKYGVEDGAYIKVHNWLGHCVMKAAYHVGMRPGMTCYFKGYAENESKSGSMGEITTDYVDPYAVNCSFFDNRVAIEPWDEKVEE